MALVWKVVSVYLLVYVTALTATAAASSQARGGVADLTDSTLEAVGAGQEWSPSVSQYTNAKGLDSVEPESLTAEEDVGEGASTTPTGSVRISGQSVFEVDNKTKRISMSSSASGFGHVNASGNVTCGDGTRQGKEQCDDGNLVDGDGCSKLCQVEGGYGCEPKFLDGQGDACFVCKESQCTILVNKKYQCLTFKSSKKGKAARQSSYVRQPSGFCGCAQNHCMDIDGAVCRPTAEGWFRNVKTGTCECSLGRCLMPYGSKTNVVASKYHCMKTTKETVRNANTTLCECAPASKAVSSDDPAQVKGNSTAACKAYPSSPILKVPSVGDVYPEFSCKGSPYVKSNTTDKCAKCAADACKMTRTVGTNRFYCAAKQTMKALQLTKAPDGSCRCKADECLRPHRDSFKCVPMSGSHPYGEVKLANGKCGCTSDMDSCIMRTYPFKGANSTSEFLCLRLRSGNVKTRYGKRFVRGPQGLCVCSPGRCRADPKPESIGSFRCVDVEHGSGYEYDKKAAAAIAAGTSKEADVPCKCAPGACKMPGDKDHSTLCTKCPTIPGECKSRCTNQGDPLSKRQECLKYCSTKHVVMKPAPAIGLGDLFNKKKFVARVIRCFITKKITCTSPGTLGSAKMCTQKISARVIFDCPGKHSKRANRKLVDGTHTHGFKSVCSRQNLECQKQRCNNAASAAVCLEKMMLS